ncbi:M14 family zinc carboxypeptidase [Bacillus sp. Marseille-Q1617]|uniref:M14 family zinc carboxypeptidase n=1 Tax=Bacillus sp. Marseille-Q1617 TaxID=2736887 RepID=UPI001589E64B|nr:M14 family zinc carboxypeptidase [Bacillus sp. Marseille-Q1617]
MNKKRVIVSTALGLALLASQSTYANPQSNPNGPYVEREQNVSLSSLMTNQELEDKLLKLEHSSQGKMQLDIAGYSNNGFPLYVAKYGDHDPDKKRVLIYTQIHGNEVLGTEAAMEIMQKFNSGDKAINEMLDEVSVWIMPRVNPDGTMTEYEGNWNPVRYNHQTWDPEALGMPADTKNPWYYNPGIERGQANDGRINYGIPGYDLNRDFNPNFDFDINEADKEKLAEVLNDEKTNNINSTGFGVSPEARAVTNVVKEFNPDFAIDVHHRGFNVLSEEDSRSVSISVLGLFTTTPYIDPFTGKTYEVDTEVEKLSKQMTVVGYQSLQRGFSSFGAIQQYPQVNYPGSGLGAIQLNGTATMLIEVKGQTQTLGQKQNGMLKETVKVPVYDMLNSIADGSINDVDANLYDEIPPAYGSISDPTTRD